MSEIRTLKDKNIEICPRTFAKAVTTSSGSTVEQELENIKQVLQNVSISNIILTDEITGKKMKLGISDSKLFVEDVEE